jgi:integrase
MGMAKLTDVQIRQWIKAGKPLPGKSDGDGLTFTLSKKGTAAWVLRYRFGGKQREVTLGNYPDLPLAKARSIAATKRVELTQGTDPATAKRMAKIEQSLANTFKELAEDYMERVAPTKSDKYRSEMRRYLDKDILPRIGGIPAKELNPAELVVMVEKIAERSKTVAKEAFSMVSSIFDHGIGKHLVTENPCMGLKVSAIIGKEDEPRKRVSLTDDQLKALLKALPDLGKENELAIRILLATAVRKGELAKARWEHIDLENGTWLVPKENQKTGRRKASADFLIPLAPQVVEWFKELKPLSFGSPMVLPARHNTGAETINHATLNRALSKLPKTIPIITPHDLRSTARSHFSALKISVVVAERCLNHSLGGLVAIYDQHDYLDERRHALSLWAAKLEALEKGQAFNVVSIRQAA